MRETAVVGAGYAVGLSSDFFSLRIMAGLNLMILFENCTTVATRRKSLIGKQLVFDAAT
ncbi:hypothetical protein [Geomonas limicola]|uniref:hypothetical protein n=1 Tax=Geomonas limicola TaxID=2740186 RepID=UPI001614320A|nr:hypothetical protein [Geomonas limicola]